MTVLTKESGYEISAAPRRIRIALVDDHQLVRGGLRRAFEAASEFEVVGEAGSIAEARAMMERQQPDVVVMDVRLPDGDGITLTADTRKHNTAIGIVILTMDGGDQYLFAALDAGASGFVGKEAPSDDVVAAARHAAANPRVFAASDLAGALRRRTEAHASPKLSARERQVLDLLVDGLAVTQIGRRLYIAETTVKTHIHKIYGKIGASNRAQAVMAAVRLGLVDQNKKR
jgi:DNA-binding NarL/FixJ family response regulator